MSGELVYRGVERIFAFCTIIAGRSLQAVRAAVWPCNDNVTQFVIENDPEFVSVRVMARAKGMFDTTCDRRIP